MKDLLNDSQVIAAVWQLLNRVWPRFPRSIGRRGQKSALRIPRIDRKTPYAVLERRLLAAIAAAKPLASQRPIAARQKPRGSPPVCNPQETPAASGSQLPPQGEGGRMKVFPINDPAVQNASVSLAPKS